MRRRVVLGLITIGVALGAFEAGALALSASAEAAAEFVFLENNKELKAGQSREWLKAADGSPYKFVRLSGAPTFSFECKGMSLMEKSSIFGGKPGTITTRMEWTSCTGSVAGKACTGITAQSTPLKGEIVELLFGPRAEFAATLLYPATGEELIRFEALCGGIPDVRVLKGNVVAEPFSQCSNLAEVELLFPGPASEVKTSAGGKVKVATTLEGSPVSITGSTSMFLFNSPKWGVC